MRKTLFIAALLVAATLFGSTDTAFAQAGRRAYSFTVLNEFHKPYTDAITVVIYDSDDDSDITSSCYTTPSGTTAFDATNLTTGTFTFYAVQDAVDVKVTDDTNGNAVKLYDLTVTDHQIMLSRNVMVESGTIYTGSYEAQGTAVFKGNMTLGVNGTGVDFKAWSDTAGDYMLWDQDGNTNSGALTFEDTDIIFNEGATFLFRAADDAVDWTIKSSVAERLDFLPAETTDDQVVAFGDADHTADLIWYTKTASNTITIDASDDQIEFAGAGFMFDQTNVDYTLDADSDLLTLVATDHASASLTIGSTGTNGLDLTIQSATSDDTVVFNAGTKIATWTDYVLRMADNTQIRFGTDNDITMEFDANGDSDLQIIGDVSFDDDVVVGNAVTDGLTITAAIQGANPLVLDGATDNTNTTTIAVADPSGTNTLTLPDDSGYFAYTPGGKTTKDATNAAIPLTHSIVEGTSGAASAWSLANGKSGQILTVVIVSDGGEATITPTTATGWTAAVLTDDIDSITVQYVDNTVGWVVLGTASNGTGIVALTQ
jgi:hypothetical protein